jgi:hypothetical protein
VGKKESQKSWAVEQLTPRNLLCSARHSSAGANSTSGHLLKVIPNIREKLK